MISKRVLLVFILSFLLGNAGFSIADEFHYTNLLIGDRASGMGGAYTAVSDDATGLYYNPAGIAYTAGRSISASVNAYYHVEKRYKSVIAGNGWVRTSSSLLPNYFGVAQPVGRFKVGISYAVPESLMADQDQVFNDLPLSTSIQSYNPGARISTYLINFNEESNTYNFGPSIATELSGKLSTGLTLYYYQRKTQWILNQLIKTTTGGSEWTNDYYQTEEWGLRPILGFMASPMEGISVGLAVSKVFIQGSDTMRQTTYRRDNLGVLEDTNGNGLFDTNDQVVYNSSFLPDGPLKTDLRRKYPVQVSLGIAWFASQSLLVTGDLNHFSEVDDQNAKAVNNLALGAEYYLDRNWAVRGGLFTDYANTPDITSGGINQSEHIDLYGLTTSVSHFTRNTSVTCGGGYTFGDGKSQIIGGSANIQNVESLGWMLFLSSSYSY